MPWTATRSPGRAGEFLEALYVVTPAHSRGAASADASSAGTAASVLVGDHHFGVASVAATPETA